MKKLEKIAWTLISLILITMFGLLAVDIAAADWTPAKGTMDMKNRYSVLNATNITVNELCINNSNPVCFNNLTQVYNHTESVWNTWGSWFYNQTTAAVDWVLSQSYIPNTNIVFDNESLLNDTYVRHELINESYAINTTFADNYDLYNYNQTIGFAEFQYNQTVGYAEFQYNQTIGFAEFQYNMTTGAMTYTDAQLINYFLISQIIDYLNSTQLNASYALNSSLEANFGIYNYNMTVGFAEFQYNQTTPAIDWVLLQSYIPNTNVAFTNESLETFENDVDIGSGGYTSGGVTLYSTGNGYYAGDILIDGELITIQGQIVNGSMIPITDNTFNLGNTSNRWIGYLSQLFLDDWTNATITESQISDLQSYIPDYTNLALTNESETFDENLTIIKDLIVSGISYLQNLTSLDSILVDYVYSNINNYISFRDNVILEKDLTVEGESYLNKSLEVGASDAAIALDIYRDATGDYIHFDTPVLTVMDKGLNVTQNLTAVDSSFVNNYFKVGNNVLYVDSSSGLVGIGTTSPTHKLNVVGDANITGNLSTNFIRGEMWNYTANATAWEFEIGSSSVYYNLTNLTDGVLNGFTTTHANDIDGGSYMTAQVAGNYKITLSISAAADAAGSLFSFAAVRNFDVTNSRNCYARRTIKSTPAGAATVDCYLDLDVGDTLNVQLENEENTQNIFVHTVNLNAMRVGD